jgi:hypothetical protein
MAAAKREAARRTLYSMFFRGPVLGTDVVEEMAKAAVDEPKTLKADVLKVETKVEVMVVEHGNTQRLLVGYEKDEASHKRRGQSKKSSRKGKEVATEREDVDDEISKGRTEARSEKKNKKRKREEEEDSCTAKLDKAERKRLKAEKRARKEEKRKMKEAKAAEAHKVEKIAPHPALKLPIVDREAEVSTTKRKKKDSREKSNQKRLLELS